MATIQSSLFSASYSSSSCSKSIKATLYSQNLDSTHLSVPSLLVNNNLNPKSGLLNLTATSSNIDMNPKLDTKKKTNLDDSTSDPNLVQELYAIMEIVAERIEMHNNIKSQRDNWNVLLLNSVNLMTATAAIMAGLACVFQSGPSILSLKISSSMLYMAVTGIVLVMNKIQPSQLAEEQRNASRLFKKLHEEIKTSLVVKDKVTSNDVKAAMGKVLALDKAFPLPLIGAMIDKFPKIAKPAVWWPTEEEEEEHKCHEAHDHQNNGWNDNLEEEMKRVLGVMKGRDSLEYERLSNVVLRVNKVLAFCGPLLTGSAAIGSCFIGLHGFGSFGAVVLGALGIVVNSLEHGGQVGMVFEMYRSSAGFFKLMEETIEYNLKEEEVGDRENGELFEVKVALQLGRSLSELRELAKASSLSSKLQQAKEEFASKLF